MGQHDPSNYYNSALTCDSALNSPQAQQEQLFKGPINNLRK